jgi:predicted transcriptional regulator
MIGYLPLGLGYQTVTRILTCLLVSLKGIQTQCIPPEGEITMESSNTIRQRDSSTNEGENLKKFFLQEKPTDMIVILRKQGTSYASELSTKADTTYSHAVKVMNRMKEIGLVKSEKKGRKKEYKLTQKGQDLADNLINMFDAVDGMEVKTHDKNEKWGLDAVKTS